MIISQVLGVGQGSSFRFRELRIRARFTPRLAIGKVSLLLCNLHVAGFRRGQFGVAAVVPAVPAIRDVPFVFCEFGILPPLGGVAKGRIIPCRPCNHWHCADAWQLGPRLLLPE